jgi:hypothetical protein
VATNQASFSAKAFLKSSSTPVNPRALHVSAFDAMKSTSFSDDARVVFRHNSSLTTHAALKTIGHPGPFTSDNALGALGRPGSFIAAAILKRGNRRFVHRRRDTEENRAPGQLHR